MAEVSRRAALTATAAAAVAGASFATGGSALAAPVAASTNRAPTRQEWVKFAKTLSGPVYLPGSSKYESGKKLFNPMFDGLEPAAVARVASTSDVQRCVEFGAKHGLKISTRAGGHSYIGASAEDGSFVLDVRGLNYVGKPDQGVSRMGSGVLGYAAHKALDAYGRSLVTGTCPTVGLAGLTLGGGLGVANRHFGVASDRLRAATVVLPDGSKKRVSNAQNADLFWALRGGGAPPCVVVSMDVATIPGDDQGVFAASFPGNATIDAITGWREWLASEPKTTWGSCQLSADGRGGMTVRVVAVTEAGRPEKSLARLERAVGTKATSSTVKKLDHMGTVDWLGGGETSPREKFVAGTDVIKRMDERAAERIVGAVRTRSQAGGTGAAIIDPLFGAVRNISTGGTAFPWREHDASVQWYGSGTSQARRWVGQAHDIMGGKSVGGYLNYLEEDGSAARYLAGNADRWRKVHRKVDPDGVMNVSLG